MTTRPFLKWAGGKTSLLPEILPRLPAKIKTYYEPFVGAGAVFFALNAEKRFKHAVLGDSNRELMRTYAVLAKHPNKVIIALKLHARLHNEKHFYTVRDQNPDNVDFDPHVWAARLIYLNRTCFNGLYRVNKKGHFNVPFGRYANPTICDEENLQAVSKVLLGSVLRAVDFEEVVFPARRGDAVYFDPPYAPASETANFAAYTKAGFTANDHARLRDVAKKLIARGVHVLLSNADTPFVRGLYKGFRIEKVQARRAINSKGDKRGHVGELLISGRAS